MNKDKMLKLIQTSMEHYGNPIISRQDPQWAQHAVDNLKLGLERVSYISECDPIWKLDSLRLIFRKYYQNFAMNKSEKNLAKWLIIIVEVGNPAVIEEYYSVDLCMSDPLDYLRFFVKQDMENFRWLMAALMWLHATPAYHDTLQIIEKSIHNCRNDRNDFDLYLEKSCRQDRDWHLKRMCCIAILLLKKHAAPHLISIALKNVRYSLNVGLACTNVVLSSIAEDIIEHGGSKGIDGLIERFFNCDRESQKLLIEAIYNFSMWKYWGQPPGEDHREY